ncbi:MAG: hypothetical protein ACYC8T_05890 [Myxococcaceae bacterium]
MERRILDFGINDTFDSLAQRWGIHYPRSISEKLVRRVVDRMGLRCEAACSAESQQLVCREKPEEPADMLVVATDGSTEHQEARAPAASPTVNRLRSQNLPGSLSEPSAHWTKTSLRRSGAAASASGWNPVGHVLGTDGCINSRASLRARNPARRPLHSGQQPPTREGPCGFASQGEARQ